MAPLRLFAILLLAALCAFCQTANPTNPDPGQPGIPVITTAPSFLSQATDPLIVSLAAWDLAQVAQGATAWKFTYSGKQYTVSPAQQTGIAAAGTVAAAAIAHKWPKLKTPLTIVLGAAAAYYGGRAYAQTLTHGTPASTGPILMPAVAIPVRRQQ